MSYKTVVTFDFQENRPWTTFVAQINNLDDVKKLVSESQIELPHTAEVIRTINIIDLGQKAKNSFFKRNAIDGHPIVSSLDGGKFSFVFPSILYSDDIKKYLMEKYGSALGFAPEENLSKTPLLFNVIKHSSVGLRNPKTGAPTYQNWRSVWWQALKQNDIVVDNNLNQLWPINTGKPPVGLIELLNNKNEKVR